MDFIESMALAGGNPAIAAAMRTAANKKRPAKTVKVKPVPAKPSSHSSSDCSKKVGK